MRISQFSIKTKYTYHLMTADGGFVGEADTVAQYLACMQKITETLTDTQMQKFQTAAAYYNGTHWHDAGMEMGKLAVDMCPMSSSQFIW